MSLKENLKSLRKKAGLTQAELAYKTGLSLSAIINYENGLREPNAKAMAALEEFFNVSAVDLYGNRKVIIRKVCKKEAPEAPTHEICDKSDFLASCINRATEKLSCFNRATEKLFTNSNLAAEKIEQIREILREETADIESELNHFKSISCGSQNEEDLDFMIRYQICRLIKEISESMVSKVWKI